MAAFVWKNICFDKAQAPLLKERREYLKNSDNDGYKRIVKELE
jgi:hypothetical protein